MSDIIITPELVRSVHTSHEEFPFSVKVKIGMLYTSDELTKVSNRINNWLVEAFGESCFEDNGRWRVFYDDNGKIAGLYTWFHFKNEEDGVAFKLYWC